MDNEIDGLDMFDIIKIMSRKKGKYAKIILANVSEEFELEGYNTDRDYGDKFYLKIRKYILDGLNDYIRSVNRTLIGDDIED